jgi:phosphonate transport system substrate-binding protein
MFLSEGNKSLAETHTDETKPEAGVTIGLVPELNLFRQFERHQPLVEYLSHRLKQKIKLKIFKRYGEIVPAFVHGDLDAAFLGSYVYILAHFNAGVEAIAKPVNVFGRSTSHGLIFVRKNSGITNAGQMKGKRFVFVDKATTAGYLFPITYFKKFGIEDPNGYFSETYFSGTYEDAVYDVINAKADVGAVKNTVLAGLTAFDKRIQNDLVFLNRSAEIPENCFAVGKKINGVVRHKLREIILSMHMSPEGLTVLRNFGAQRFVEASDEDYTNMYEYLREIGIKIESYDYIGQP